MYFPYLRGRQFELIAIRELIDNHCISSKVVPIIEPVRASSTLINTLSKCNETKQPIAFIINPIVGTFRKELINFGKCKDLLSSIENENVIKAYLVDDKIDAIEHLLARFKTSVDKALFVFNRKEFIDKYNLVINANSARFNLIPDERDFRRGIHKHRVILSDAFHMQDRNSDYPEEPEIFSTDHLYYADDGYLGFSDYSIVGNKFLEAGFAPYCLVIHIVYFDAKKQLMVKHFRSKSNEDATDPANKFREALESLLKWNETAKLNTYAIRQFKNFYYNGDYPGLGTIKKLSIMHHIELINDYLIG